MKHKFLTLSMTIPVLLTSGQIFAEEINTTQLTASDKTKDSTEKTIDPKQNTVTVTQEDKSIPQQKTDTLEFNTVTGIQKIEKTRTVDKEEKYTEKVEKTRIVEKKGEAKTLAQSDAELLWVIDATTERSEFLEQVYNQTLTYLRGISKGINVKTGAFNGIYGEAIFESEMEYGFDKVKQNIENYFASINNRKPKIVLLEGTFRNQFATPKETKNERVQALLNLRKDLESKGIQLAVVADYKDIVEDGKAFGLKAVWSGDDRKGLLDNILNQVIDTKAPTTMVEEKYFEDVTKSRVVKVPEKYTEDKSVIETLRVELNKTDDTGKFDSIVLKDSDGKKIDLKLSNNVGEFTPTKSGKHTIEYAVSSTGEKVVDFTVTVKTTSKAVGGIKEVAKKSIRLEAEKKGASLVYDIPELQIFTTRFVDENDTEIKEKIISTTANDKTDITGYEFIKTEKIGNETKHIYRKIIPIKTKSEEKILPKTGEALMHMGQFIGYIFTMIGGIIFKNKK